MKFNKGVIFTSITGLKIKSISNSNSGLWVRSYYNMLQKRAIILSDCIKVILIDGHKWDRNPEGENAFFLFTTSEWEHVMQTTPCAFCLTTYHLEKKNAMEKHFKSRNFQMLEDKSESESGRDLYTLIFYNSKFGEHAYDV